MITQAGPEIFSPSNLRIWRRRKDCNPNWLEGGEGSVSVGMSLVISSGFGFERILCIYAGSESRKSTESSSKTSRKGDHLRAALMD